MNDGYSAIVFEDGSVMYGKSSGMVGITTVELCFTTGMTGYQEAMTDPSYAGQAIVFSFPHIGNTGVNKIDVESSIMHIKATITKEKISLDSNFRSTGKLDEALKKNKVFHLHDFDTRAIIKKITSHGSQNASIITAENDFTLTNDQIKKFSDQAKNYVIHFDTIINDIFKNYERNKIINQIVHESKKNSIKTAVIDYGIKFNILKMLNEHNFNITVFPCTTQHDKINFDHFDCIVLSNGPADPRHAIKLNEKLINKIINSKKPILGICLGHQMIILAHNKLNSYLTISKMHQGHRGINHPILNLETKKVEITSQNHGYNAFVRHDFIKNTKNTCTDIGAVSTINHVDTSNELDKTHETLASEKANRLNTIKIDKLDANANPIKAKTNKATTNNFEHSNEIKSDNANNIDKDSSGKNCNIDNIEDLEFYNEAASYITHKSLFDNSIAGVELKEEKILSVQYHPESSSGTHDSRYIFEKFKNIVLGKFDDLYSQRKLSDLEKNLGYIFKAKNLLMQSLRHPSIQKNSSYEKLEFIGDKILNTILAESLLNKFPKNNEGELSLKLNNLVSGKTIVQIALNINLGKYIEMSHSEELSKGQNKKSNLEDCMEAVIGGIFIDSESFEITKKIVLNLWNPVLQNAQNIEKDYKSQLQEWLQKNHFDLPQYELVEKSGPSHNPEFTVRLIAGNLPEFESKGPSLKEAQSKVAKMAMLYIANQ